LCLFWAFFVAFFPELYGFPLSIYLLSGWLTAKFPGINWLSHDAGHLPEMLFGWKVNPHFGPFHIVSNVFILGGFWLLSKAWPVITVRKDAPADAKDWEGKPDKLSELKR